jgi:hypothetical protein
MNKTDHHLHASNHSNEDEDKDGDEV